MGSHHTNSHPAHRARRPMPTCGHWSIYSVIRAATACARSGATGVHLLDEAVSPNKLVKIRWIEGMPPYMAEPSNLEN
jgi:hypothetical protein